jgi:hypothetical protein
MPGMTTRMTRIYAANNFISLLFCNFDEANVKIISKMKNDLKVFVLFLYEN